MRNLITIFIVLLNSFGKFTHERICQFRVLNSPLHIIILTTGAMGSNSVDHTLGANDSVAEASILMVRTTDSLVTSNRRDGPRKDSAVKEVSLIPSFQPEQSIIFNNKKFPANHDTSIHESQAPTKNKSAAAPSPAPRKMLNGQPFVLKDVQVPGTPTPASVSGTPTNALSDTPTAASVSGIPTAASVPGTPTTASVPGTPTNASVSGTPTAASVPGVPTAASVPGIPTAASVPGTPTAASVPGTPTAASVPSTPTAASVPGTPTAAPVPGTPTAASVPGTPTAAPVPGTPTAASVPGTPTAASVPGTPTAASVPGTPTAAPVPGTPTAAPVPGTPTAASVPGIPTAASVPGTPTAAPVPGTPSAHDSQSPSTDISNQNGGGSDTVVDKAASHDFVSTNSKSAVAFLVIFVLMITCYLRRCKSSSSPAENYIRVPQGDTGEVRQSCTISWKR